MAFFVKESLQSKTLALQNLGIVDRTSRFVIGVALISIWLILPYPVGSGIIWFALLPFLGIYPVVTGILGWCPIYAMLKTKTCGTGKRNNCGTFPDQLYNLIRPH